MNKLLIPNGGMPFTGDDLLFMQEGLRIGIKGVISHLVDQNGNAILSGCEVTVLGSDVSISEGYVVCGGEICYIAEQTLFGFGAQLNKASIELLEQVDPAGSDVFADLTTKDTYQLRLAYPVGYLASPPGNVMRLDLIDQYRYYQSIEVADADLLNSWIYPTSSEKIQMEKSGNVVYVRGYVAAGGTGTVVFKAPLGLRPHQKRSMFTTINGAGTSRIDINTSGDVSVILGTGDTSAWMYGSYLL